LVFLVFCIDIKPFSSASCARKIKPVRDGVKKRASDQHAQHVFVLSTIKPSEVMIMIIQMKRNVTEKEVQATVDRLMELAAQANVRVEPKPVPGETTTTIPVLGTDLHRIDLDQIEQLAQVETAIRVGTPYKLASRDYIPETRAVKINGTKIGNGNLCVIAGPCSVEDYETTLEAARRAKEMGADMFRAGAYKPRTSPYSFQGMEEEGLGILQRVRKETGLAIVSEITRVDTIDKFLEYDVDIFQIGTRNGQNSELVREVARGIKGKNKAMLLKRGFSTEINEYALMAEYALMEGLESVILCLRSVRGGPNGLTRGTVDTGDIGILRTLTNLPVIYDPSHAAGKRELVYDISLGAIGHGAQGLLVEAHPTPESAASDGRQTLYMENNGKKTDLGRVIADCRRMYHFREDLAN
jgi:3-deoxy-7-phosphoheptulonate synthase